MQMYERLKLLRKDILKITQDELSQVIGVSRSNLASIETGRINLTERNIKSICDRFNVSDAWLRNGIEPKFMQLSKEEEIASYMGDLLSSDKNDFQKRFIRALSKLDNDGWDVLEKLITDITEKK